MRSVLLATAAGISLWAASIATAASDYSVTETRRIAYDYARCVIGNARNAAAASDVLLGNVDNDTIKTKYGRLIDGNCLVSTIHAGGQMKFPADLYDYALADALVGRELAALPVPNLSNVAPLERRKLPPEPAPPPANAGKSEKARYAKALKDFDDAKSLRALGEYGECIVRTNPAGAKALLLTRPETAAETSSFDALRDAFAQCLPEGRTLSFGKVVLRGTIAVNYYRLAQAADPVPVR